MKHHPAKVVKVVVAVFFIVVLGIVIVSFVRRSREAPEAPLISKEIEQQKIEKKEKIEYFEVKGEKGNFRGRADRQYVGEDNRYHLEGNVEIDFLDRSEEEDIRLLGDEVVYDKKGTNFHLTGGARGEFKDLTVESPYLDYDAKKKVFKSDKGVRYSSRKLSGTAAEVEYFVGAERGVLEGDVFMEFIPQSESSLPLKIHARQFEFSKKLGSGFAEGEVKLFRRRSRATGDFLRIKLDPEQKNVESLTLKENARVEITGERADMAASQDKASLVFYADKQEIEADEIVVEGFDSSPQVKRLRGRGNCTCKFSSSSGDFTEVQAEQITFVLDENGKLQRFRSLKNAKITEKKGELEEWRTIEGDVLETNGEKETLLAKGKKGVPARIHSSDHEISAENISVSLESGDLEAGGDVRVVLYLRKDSPDASGFFSEGRPVFITAQRVRYLDAEKRFSFSEKVRSWQEEKMILANELSFSPESRKITSENGVETVLPAKSEKEKEEERLRLSSEKMQFLPEQNLVVYENNSLLKVKDLVLRARILCVKLDQESGEMKEVVAKGDVIINQNKNEGRGDEAYYDVKKEMIILSGNTVFIDKESGRTEGAKLTFYIPDGRIVVENKDRERSVTVIKS